MAAERERCFGGTLPTSVGEWLTLLGRGAARMGRFLRAVGLLVDRTDGYGRFGLTWRFTIRGGIVMTVGIWVVAHL